MWGKLTEFVQDKLETSTHEEERPTDGNKDSKATIENLRKALNEAECRNENINREFKKLLREKETELQSLRKNQAEGGSRNGHDDEHSEYSSSISGLQEQMTNLKEELTEKEKEIEGLKAKSEERVAGKKSNKGSSSQVGIADKRIEELEELLAQKDKNLQHLLQELESAEQQSKQTWEQKRINEEKVMGELAAKIQHNTTLVTKLEETEQLLAEREKSIQELCDKNEAKERLIKSRDEVISQLQMSKDVSGGTDDVLAVLQEQIQSQQEKITELADEVDRNRRNLKEKESVLIAREKSLENIQHQMQEQTSTLSELSVDRDNLMEKITLMERDHNEIVAKWQKQVRMKEETMAMEMSQVETSFKESEHMLKEDIEEKANIIQSKDEAIAVLKRTIQERALGSSSDVGLKGMSEEGEKLIKVLEKQLEETKEILNTKTDALEKYDKELNEKRGELLELQIQSQQQVKELKEKLETETLLTAELREQLTEKDKEIGDSKLKVDHFREELDQLSKEFDATKNYLEERTQKLSKLETEDASGKVSDLSQTLKKLENTLEERDAKVTELNILTGKLQERVESLTHENQRVHESMVEKENDLNEQLVKVKDELQSVSEKHEVELSEKKLKIKQQEEYLEEKDRTISLLNKEMAEERSELTEKLEESLNEKDEMEKKLQQYKNEIESKKEENISLEKQVVELKERMDEMNSELAMKMEEMKEREDSKAINQNEEPMETIVDVVEKETLRELAECPESAVEKIEFSQLQSTFDEPTWSDAENKDIGSSVHSKIEELEKNFDDVKIQLTEEINKNMLLREHLVSLQEEKNNTEVRCAELKQALEEFIYSTDKRGIIDLDEKTTGEEQKEMDETIQGGQDVSTMFQDQSSRQTKAMAATSESFGEVVRLLEEEKSSLERKLEVATKERNALRTHVEELEEMLENKRQPTTETEENQDVISGDQNIQEDIAQDTDTLRTMVHESEEAEHQLQEQVKFYQEELQRESEDNELLRSTLSHLETQIQKGAQELAASEAKLTEMLQESESLKLMMEEVRKENQSLCEEKGNLENELERTEDEARRVNENNQEILSEVTVALNARVEEREELLREAKMAEERLNDELQRITSLNVSLEDMNCSLQEETETKQKQTKAKEEEIESLRKTIEEKQSTEVELNNAKKVLAKMKKKFNSFREEKQAELEKKDEDISQLLDRVAEVENLRRIEGEKIDEEIKKLSERIIEAEVVNEEVIKRGKEEVKMMSEKISHVEKMKEVAIEEKRNEVVELLEKLRSAELVNEKTIKEKDDEIASMKQDLQIELDNANEFVLSQVNLLKQELLESRNALAESETEVESLKENILNNEEELKKLKVNENNLLETLRVKDAELERLISEKESDQSSVAVEEIVEASKMDVSEAEVEEETPLRSADDASVLQSQLNAKEEELQKQTEQLQVIAKKFTAMKKKFGQQKEQMKEKNEMNKRLNDEKEQLFKTCAELNDKLTTFEDLSEEKGILEHSLHSKDRTLELLNTEINRFQENIVSLENEKREMTTSLASSEDEVTYLRRQLDTASGQLESLETMSEQQQHTLSQEMNSKNKEIGLLLEQLKENQELVRNKEKELKRLKTIIDEEISTHSEQLSVWKTHVESSTSEINDLQKELQEKVNLIDVSNEKMALLCGRLDDQVCEKTLLGEEMNKVMTENEELKSALQMKSDKESELEEIERELVSFKQRYEEQGMELFNLKEELQEALHQLESMEELVEQKRSLEGLLEVREIEINDLRTQSTDVGTLRENMNDKNIEIQQLQDVLREKSGVEKKLAAEVETLRTELGESSFKIADLESSIHEQILADDLQQQLKTKDEELRQLQDVLCEKSSVEKKLAAEVETLRTELGESSFKIADLESSIHEQILADDLQQQLKTKDEELQQLQEILNEKSTLVEKLSDEVQSLGTQHTESSFKIADLESSIQEQDLLKGQLINTEEKLFESQEALIESQKITSEIHEQCQKLRDENGFLETNLSQKGQELEGEIARRGDFENNVAEMNQELDRLRVVKENQDDVIEKLQSELGVRNTEITALQDNVNIVQELSDELETAKMTIGGLERALEEASSKTEQRREVDELSKTGQDHVDGSQGDSIKEENESLQEKITVLSKERGQLRKKLATMKKASLEIGKQHKQLQNALEQKEKEISKLIVEIKESRKREVALENRTEEMRNDKESMEAEFEDTVKELKEIGKEKQELTREKDTLKELVQHLEAEKDWNSSETENLRVELEEKMNESFTLVKEIDDMKASSEEQMKKKIEDVLMEKDLEKAECEEEFAKQINQVCAQKDNVITQLKDTIEELSTSKQHEIENLKEMLQRKENEIKTLHEDRGVDKAPETAQQISSKNEKIQELTEEIRNLKDEVQIVGDGREALDNKLHEALVEKQNLYEQLQLVTEEKDRLENSSNSEGKQELETLVQEKEKLIGALKKKVKELRREKAASEAKSKKEAEDKEFELLRSTSVEAPPKIVQEVYQKTEVAVVEGANDTQTKNDVDINYEKIKDELEHMRHERNVYEESYIRLQRDLDQTQKENESLLADIQSKQDVIDGFDSRLKEITMSTRKEHESKMDEREKSLSEAHGKENSELRNLLQGLEKEKKQVTNEITKLQEEQKTLLEDKEEISEDKSKIKHQLDTVLEQLQTTQDQLTSLKEKCSQLTGENERLLDNVTVSKKAKEKIKQKLKEVLQRSEVEKSSLLEELQQVKTEKAETCNTLRTEFGDALDSRDNQVHHLKEKLDALTLEKQQSEEELEKLCRQLRQSLKEENDKNEKLEEETIQLKTILENLSIEISKVRDEKDSIGDTIRSEFDHICSGLRIDLENAIKEKEEIYRSLEVGRLGLEKELIEKEETFDGLMQIVKEKDEILNAENSESLKLELERLKREISANQGQLEQEKRVVEQKNAMIQTLDDERKRLLSERNEALEKTQEEVTAISSSKDNVINKLESRLTETTKEHALLSEKYEEIATELREIIEHIVSCVRENTEEPRLLELIDEEFSTANEARRHSKMVVSQVVEDWVETKRRLERESRQWQTEEESYKLEIEKLTKEKKESCEKIEKEMQASSEEKDEVMEGLLSQLNQSRKENELIEEESAGQIKQLEETLNNEQRSRRVEKEELLEKLKNAGVQIQESENELTRVMEQVEKNSEEIEKLNKEKDELKEIRTELESTVAETKEEVESLERDLAVVQNERKHFEQSLLRNIEQTNEDFKELFLTLGREQTSETLEDSYKLKNELHNMVSQLVKEGEESREVNNKLKEEKRRVCEEIREEFETALLEKEKISEESRKKLKSIHKECDELKIVNNEKDYQVKKMEAEMVELRNKLGDFAAAEETNRATTVAGHHELGESIEGQITSGESIEEEELVTKSVVENVMSETQEELLTVPPSPSLAENNVVLSNELSVLSNENSSLKEQLANLENLYNERNSQTSLLVEDVIKLREENNSLKEMVEASRLGQSQLSDVQEEHDTMKRDLEDLQMANESLKDELEESRSREENKTNDELMAIIRDKELVTQRLEHDLMSYSKDISELKEELGGAKKERAAYEKLRRDFDHIVSGLRGDMERALLDREEKSKMLDDLRSQVSQVKDATDEKHDSEKVSRRKSSETVDQGSQSLETVGKELESVKHRLREVTLINRQLKQLGKSLDAELKETRRDKQLSETKCQDLRNEMEAFVKEKEAIIVESRERVETSKKIHDEIIDQLRNEYDEKIREITTGNEKSSAQVYKELQSVNEELQLKLNDSYAEINNIAQIEETNSILKQELEAIRLEKINLKEKVEELKEMVNEADGEIELRDYKLQELRENLREIMEEKQKIEYQLQENLEKQTQDPPERRDNALGNEGRTDGIAKNNSDLILSTQAIEVTSESAKLEKELIQTSSERDSETTKIEDQLHALKEELAETQAKKTMTEQELEKNKKITTKLKSMVKNLRSEVENLRKNLENVKNETLEKEQTMQRLRGDMAELVTEKENLVEKLMSRLKASDVKKDESMNNLRSEYNDILKKREADIEEMNRELTNRSSRADELKAQLDMWRESYNDVSEKMNNTENELKDIQSSLDTSLIEHSKTKETSDERLTQAAQTIEKLTESLKTVTHDLENCEKLKNEVEANLVLVRAEMDSSLSQKDNVIEDLQKQVDVANQSLQEITLNLQEKSKNCEELLKQNENEGKRFRSFQEEVDAIFSQKDDVIHQKDDVILELEKDLANANESIYKISEKLKEKSELYESALNERGTLEQQLNETQKESENSSLLQEKALENTIRNLDAANSRVEELFQKLNETSSVVSSERKRKEELDEISATLRKDLELRTEQKRELEDVVMNLNIDLEKALRDREELRQALRVKQTVTQGCDNACFDEEIIRGKEKELTDLEAKLVERDSKLLALNQQLNETQGLNEALNSELKKAEEIFQESLVDYQHEKQQLEQAIAKLEHDLEQSRLTKEEAVNVLRLKLEQAVEETGDLTSSLKNEYNTMLSEKDDRITNLREEIQRVNEEFTNLGYRFELTLQDNVNKGNSIIQLQNELKEKVRIVEENDRLEQRVKTMAEHIRVLEEELDRLKDNSNKSDSEKLYDELQTSKAFVKTLEKQLALNKKESDLSKTKQKKEFKRLTEALQFDLEHCRKQNLEKEKSLQNLRVELEEVVKQKEILFQRIRTPTKERSVERLQRTADPDGNVVEKLREEKRELLRDLDKARQQKDDIFAKFHNISDGLRRDLEEAINVRDENVQECLKANVMLDKIERENTELRKQLEENKTAINQLTANLDKKSEQNDSLIGQLRAENEKIKTTLAQELMNSRQTIVKSHSTNEELKQSLAKAEFDREKLRNYVASKEVESEELKRQLTREMTERKRVSEELRKAGIKEVEEAILESSVENYQSFNKTRNELDETDYTMFDASVQEQQNGTNRGNQLSSRLAEAARIQDETNLQLTELEEALLEERTRREELEVLLDEQHKRKDHRVNIEDEETMPLTGSPAVQTGQFYSHRASNINRRGQTSLLSLRGCLHSSGLLARLLCGQARGRWPLMLYLIFVHIVVIVCLYWAYSA